jgi:hypothetical protein
LVLKGAKIRLIEEFENWKFIKFHFENQHFIEYNLQLKIFFEKVVTKQSFWCLFTVNKRVLFRKPFKYFFNVCRKSNNHQSNQQQNEF